MAWCEWLSHHVAKALINEACAIGCHCFAFGLCKQTFPVLTTRVLKLKFLASLLPDILLIMPFIRVRTGIISQDCQVSEPRLFQRPTMSRLDRWDDDLKELGKCHCVTLPSSAVHNHAPALSGVLKNWIVYSNIYPTRCNVTQFIFIWKLLYIFRVVVPPPILRSANNCIYSIWYLSHRNCCLPLSWKSWNWFECDVGGVRQML